MTYQDIQLTNEDLRNQYIQDWVTEQYSQALALLQNAQFTDKVNNATMWNSITTDLTNVENLSDPTFKSDRIQVASTPPTLTSGEVYFQII